MIPMDLVRGCELSGNDIDAAAVLVELHLTIDESKKRPVGTSADVLALHELGSPLTDEDSASGDLFAAETFHAEALAYAVTAVTAAALTFFVCHMLILLKFDFLDLEDGFLLAMADRAVIAFAPLHFESDQFGPAFMFDHIRDDSRVLNVGSSDRDFAVIAHKQDAIERIFVAGFRIQAVNDQSVSRADAVFPATRLNNSVHKIFPIERGSTKPQE